MKFSLLAVIGSLAAYVTAAPATGYAVHEKRDITGSGWAKRDTKLNRDALIPMSIGLTQRNLENGYDLLMDVSHPESPNFGKHWSMKEVCIMQNPLSKVVRS
jgi:tripeptidyl-peptidase-1